MISLNTSSISLAMRTANNSRATMDKMATQIATGKKVNSVKDDGASYARSITLKSQQAQVNGRGQLLSMLRAATETQMTIDTATIDAIRNMKEIWLKAKDYTVGSSQRASLQQEFQGQLESLETLDDTDAIFSGAVGTVYSAGSPQGAGIISTASDPILSTNNIWAVPLHAIQTWWSNQPVNGVPFNANNLVNATNTEIDNMINYSDLYDGVFTSFVQESGRDQKWLDGVEKRDISDNDRLELAISSLTDADMGKVSTARANADTRQQLALSTIQNAISHYGNIASGLLNNVIGSQLRIIS